MLLNTSYNSLLSHLLDLLELPASTYDQAAARYKDIGEWLGRNGSSCAKYSPMIFPQGSFMLGTANKPLPGVTSYDLDLGCKLRTGLSPSNITQKDLKQVIGDELQAFREARHIKAPLDAKHRCWCLEYQDGLSFHIDILPCIPADQGARTRTSLAITQHRLYASLATSLSDTTVFITDDRHPHYREISNDWEVSNPEGFGKWFTERMNLSNDVCKAASITPLPLYRFKSPLQRVVQLLKRHRDLSFKGNTKVQPASIIISTLAAQSYNGEVDLVSAVNSVLLGMPAFVNENVPYVPNPSNPNEDFADRWSNPIYSSLNLEANFRGWLAQAKRDFGTMLSSDTASSFSKAVQSSLAVECDSQLIDSSFQEASSSSATETSATVIREAPKPWSW